MSEGESSTPWRQMLLGAEFTVAHKWKRSLYKARKRPREYRKFKKGKNMKQKEANT